MRIGGGRRGGMMRGKLRQSLRMYMHNQLFCLAGNICELFKYKWVVCQLFNCADCNLFHSLKANHLDNWASSQNRRELWSPQVITFALLSLFLEGLLCCTSFWSLLLRQLPTPPFFQITCPGTHSSLSFLGFANLISADGTQPPSHSKAQWKCFSTFLLFPQSLHSWTPCFHNLAVV